MHILVTGGAGYIGSHTVIALLEAGHTVAVVDNLSNSKKESLKRVEKITGKTVPLHVFDIGNEKRLRELFEVERFDAVIHFAGLKSVSESVEKPLLYYENNVSSSLTLIRVMEETEVKKIVFSSSATVYGAPESVPISEDAPIHSTNPYGKTKIAVEQILQSFVEKHTGWHVSILRYFNPVGAHDSGEIGEDPNGIPNNLFPYCIQVASGKLTKLKVFGDDYDTSDGTGVRDYIHVVDLARGHVLVLDHVPEENSLEIYNLGTGNGHSVFEVSKMLERVSGKTIDYEIAPRRKGDVAVCYASVEKAKRSLHFQTEKTLEDACEDAWRWQVKNPNGYGEG